MIQILDALKGADALVLASPVYYFTVSAQLKLALDRTYALLSVGTPIKRAALLVTCGDKTEEAAEGAVVMYKHICTYSKWENAGIVIVPGLHGKDDIAGRDELKKAWMLGIEI